MKLICTQENLLEGLKKVASLAGKNPTLPILSNISIKTEGNRIRLSSTDLEIGINCWIRGKIQKGGGITVPAKIILEYVDNLPAENIELKVEDHTLNIQSDSFSAQIRGEGMENFPLIPKIKKENGLQIPIFQLYKAFKQVSFAVALDDSRPEISGVLIKKEKDKIYFTATDSYRLAEKKIVHRENIPNFSFILPQKTVIELTRIISNTEGEVGIFPTENQVLFHFNDVDLISRLIEGKYPDYQQIIPLHNQTEIKINKLKLTKAIKGASLFAKSGVNNITLEIHPPKNIKISAQSEQWGSNKTVIEGEIKGEKCLVNFNYKYLLDGLNNIGTDEVFLGLSGEASPCVFKTSSADDYLYIVMPIKA